MTCDTTGDLFGAPPEVIAHEENMKRLGHKLARRGHPETSRTAADAVAVKLGELQRRVLDLIARNPGLTVSELAAITRERDPRAIGRRLSELLAQGKVIREVRVCTVTGKSASTWRLP